MGLPMRMRPSDPRLILLVTALALPSGPLHAQGAPGAHAAQGGQDVTELPALGGAARADLKRLLAEATSAGLPVHQLQSKIREGVARGVPAERIVAVVRANVTALHESRQAIGAASTADEIEAGAAALRAGVPRDALVRVRQHRPRGDVTTTLAVWTDLVTRGVPSHVVSGAIDRILPLGPGDETLLALREAVAAGSAANDPRRAQDLMSRFVDGLDKRPPAPSPTRRSP